LPIPRWLTGHFDGLLLVRKAKPCCSKMRSKNIPWKPDKLMHLHDYVLDMKATTHDYVLMGRSLKQEEEYAGLGG
jgi:hypothetical protein